MKRITIYFLFMLAALSGCENALEFPVRDKVTLDNYFETEDDAFSSVMGVYDALGEVDLYKSKFWLIQDIGSDDCDALSTWNDPNAHQIDQYELQASNTYTTGVWRASYQLIARANLAIEGISGIAMDEVQRDKYLGEARFLRALSYFNLVRLFGKVPLVLKPETDLAKYLVPRTSVDSVYGQIISDLEFAADVLPSSYAALYKGRATRGAALGILAKVYLTRQEWGSAISAIEDLEDLQVYSLWDDYQDNFREANKNGKESIFEVQFYSEVINENSQIVISGLPSIYAFPAGVGIILPTEDLLNSFEEGDHRYEVTFFDEYTYFGHNTFDPHIWKYWDRDVYAASETGQSGANFPVMRYAEVLLMYAEALNELNNGPTTEAYDAVNEVRRRARNGNAAVLPDLSDLNYTDFRDAVLKEKRCETVNEGQRWFDLVRTGKLVEYVSRAKGSKANPQEFNMLLPIPQRELDLNPSLTQNYNY